MDTDFTDFIQATVAQLVERWPEEPGVGGSTPSGGTIQAVVVEW